MQAQKRYELAGEFRLVPLTGGAWRLSRPTPAADVILRQVDFGAVRLREDAVLTDLLITWGEAVTVSGSVDGERRTLHAASAIVHEPLDEFYAALFTAPVDEPYARFWRRVFWLARLPGGRWLLEVLARRGRKVS